VVDAHQELYSSYRQRKQKTVNRQLIDLQAVFVLCHDCHEQAPRNFYSAFLFYGPQVFRSKNQGFPDFIAVRRLIYSQ